MVASMFVESPSGIGRLAIASCWARLLVLGAAVVCVVAAGDAAEWEVDDPPPIHCIAPTASPTHKISATPAITAHATHPGVALAGLVFFARRSMMACVLRP